MDRNQMIGLGLMAALLITYAVIFKPPVTEEDLATPTATEQVTEQPSLGETTTKTESIQDTSRANYDEQYGIFSSAVNGTAKEITIENDVAKFTFSSKGGLVKAVELKDFTTWDKRPLILFDENTSSQALVIQTTKGNINLADLFFNSNQTSRTIVEGDSLKLEFNLDLGGNNSIVQTYTLAGGSYVVGYD
ncbi:MAG: YidC/Oxa1 family membrane protein insertase, partial [Roseivirga sp.]